MAYAIGTNEARIEDSERSNAMKLAVVLGIAAALRAAYLVQTLADPFVKLQIQPDTLPSW